MLDRTRLAGQFREAQQARLFDASGAHDEYGNGAVFRGALQDDSVEVFDTPRKIGQAAQGFRGFFDAAMNGGGALEIEGFACGFTLTLEFRLLYYLASRPNRVFTRDQLLDAVWGTDRFVTPRSVDVYVRRLREKIESDPENPIHLKTVRGAGYLFETRAA